MSRVKSGVFERSEFPVLQRILNFYPLRNLASNEPFINLSYLFFKFFKAFSYFSINHSFNSIGSITVASSKK
ncbi:riboflavin synthase subunit alpha [Fusobacterium pseudoperiodonticum]|uniref:Riboflavin synthase subunit alpha n=2 Tax=Fusobacterium TaxID=848 RepID=A0AAD0ANS1_9FUSO|nr:riboflavin synthase subunit alpha [Fusobacterium pseudoperiodonticum]ATV62172.1 riboflavin synthase subunit alpha [Fusobacterium pseudoperiodonticum]